MKLDLATHELFTDEGELIKKLHCPLRQRWEQLAAQEAGPHRHCGHCERTVFDTATLTDAELLALVRADPAACLTVSAAQPNVALA